jgi:hypothetical protein
MVNFDRPSERVEEILYGTNTSEECKVILELFGVHEDVEMEIESRFHERFDNIRVQNDGLSMEIEFLNKRADYKDIKNLAFRAKMMTGNVLDGSPMSGPEIGGLLDSNDVRGMMDKISMEAMAKLLRRFEAHMKPGYNVQRLQTMRPRPKIAFELQYNVPRGASLRDVKGDMEEQIDKGLMGNIGEIELLEDGDAIILIPLQTVFDINDFDILDFDMSGTAQRMAEEMTGVKIEESPRLDRAVVTCTEVG